MTLVNANRQILLRARPEGLAGPEHFAEFSVPVQQPGPGEALLESLYISIDPAMRTWITENPGYVPSVQIGSVMRAGGVARVLESQIEGLRPGDLVQGRLGWQSHPTLPASALQKLDLSLGTAEDWIGPLGTSALTAYFGMTVVGDIRPGNTVLVSGSAGAVGQIAAQVAKLMHCRVIGIAGGPDKCAFLKEALSLDEALDYKSTDDLAAAIANVADGGIDVFFDNVGGRTLEAAIQNMRVSGRIALCGRISQTTAPVPYGVKNLGLAIGKRIRMQGFIVSDFHDQYSHARAWLAGELASGRLTQRLHILEGLEKAPEGLRMLFTGENFGKLAVKISH